MFPLIVLLRSHFQIFCFLLYSRLACTTTWVVPINFLKLIRSDWFASNITLLVLAAVVPLCSSTYNFGFFASYNAVCTMCNLLFVIILNKHKFVTRYVFYISVCMIFALCGKHHRCRVLFCSQFSRILKQLKTNRPSHRWRSALLWKWVSVLPCTSYGNSINIG